MRIRRTSAPSVLGSAAAVVGGIGIVSALTPELASRLDIVQGVLPPGVPEAARLLSLAFAFGLIWLWRSLSRRKRRAWQLAVALVVASALAHLAKGLDFEEAAGSLLLLGALWRYRHAFDRPGDPETIRPLVQVGLAGAAVAGLLVLSSHDTLVYSDRIEDALVIVAAGLGVRALYLWLRPLASRVQQTARERALAEAVVRKRGADSLSYFALRRDKSYFFSPSGRSFLAYRVVGGAALVSGDPIGEPAELPELVAEFHRLAQASGWRLGVLGCSPEQLPLYETAGLKSLYLGDEAVVRPETFSLEGRRIRKVRQSVSRLERAGFRVELLRAADAGELLRREIAGVAAVCRGRWPERGFTMAMDDLFAYDDAVLAVAFDSAGRVGAFMQLVPSPASGGYSLATMRRRRDTPNGLMEFLIVRTIEWAACERVPELSLNFAVFGDVLRAGSDATRAKRGFRLVLLRLDRVFQLERLHSFSRKFAPEWRPRYVCFERWLDFPIVGLAYLHAESLLSPPRPWIHEEIPA
jgi:lysyl-tRNA synthetase class 2